MENRNHDEKQLRNESFRFTIASSSARIFCDRNMNAHTLNAEDRTTIMPTDIRFGRFFVFISLVCFFFGSLGSIRWSCRKREHIIRCHALYAINYNLLMCDQQMVANFMRLRVCVRCLHDGWWWWWITENSEDIASETFTVEATGRMMPLSGKCTPHKFGNYVIQWKIPFFAFTSQFARHSLLGKRASETSAMQWCAQHEQWSCCENELMILSRSKSDENG